MEVIHLRHGIPQLCRPDRTDRSGRGLLLTGEWLVAVTHCWVMLISIEPKCDWGRAWRRLFISSHRSDILALAFERDSPLSAVIGGYGIRQGINGRQWHGTTVRRTQWHCSGSRMGDDAGVQVVACFLPWGHVVRMSRPVARDCWGRPQRCM